MEFSQFSTLFILTHKTTIKTTIKTTTRFSLFAFMLATVQCLLLKQEVMSHVEFPQNCTDGDGNIRAHKETWSSSLGSCDKQVCYDISTEPTSMVVTYSCPPEVGNVDTVNCRYQGNSSLPFPECCPVLTCDRRQEDNATQTACADISPQKTCDFWRQQSNCTTSADPIIQQLYNFTTKFCKRTCGFCT